MQKGFAPHQLKTLDERQLQYIIENDYPEEKKEQCRLELERRKLLKRIRFLLDVKFDFARRASLATNPEVRADFELKFFEVSKLIDECHERLAEIHKMEKKRG